MSQFRRDRAVYVWVPTGIEFKAQLGRKTPCQKPPKHAASEHHRQACHPRLHHAAALHQHQVRPIIMISARTKRRSTRVSRLTNTPSTPHKHSKTATGILPSDEPRRRRRRCRLLFDYASRSPCSAIPVEDKLGWGRPIIDHRQPIGRPFDEFGQPKRGGGLSCRTSGSPRIASRGGIGDPIVRPSATSRLARARYPWEGRGNGLRPLTPEADLKPAA